MTFEYGSESPYWYFLAHRAAADAEATLSDCFVRLNRRASELALPIAYGGPHATAWAVLCRLFNDAQSRAAHLDRLAFSVMKIGLARVFGPKDFVATAFYKLLHNIQDPAFPWRSRDDSVVDTFLANGLKLVDERAIDPSDDARTMSACVVDMQMHSTGECACRPSPTLWDDTVNRYAQRRPGWVRRQLSDPNRWLFE